MADKSKKQMILTANVTGIGWANGEQACVYSNISKDTLRLWLDDGLKHSRIGGLLRIRYSDIDKYLMKYEVGTGPIDVDEDVSGIALQLVKNF